MMANKHNPGEAPKPAPRLCPLRNMQPCSPACAWFGDDMCAMRSLANELFYAVEAIAASTCRKDDKA